MYPSKSFISLLPGLRQVARISLKFCATAEVATKCRTSYALLPVFAAALLAGTATGAGPAEARGYTSIIIDAQSGAVLQNDSGDARNYPASLTKMMTLYLTFEALDTKKLRLDQEIPISQHAANQSPSKLGLSPGETIKVEHAILAVVTKSANDIAVALGEALGGSEAAFSVMMTRKAQALGMSRTTFRNASGLPNDQQMSTPRDMATLGLALIQDWPQYYRYFSRTSFTYNGQTMANHNHLMSRYPGMDGIKTGFINKSGFNLVASVVRNGRRVVAVVFGGPSARGRDNYMASLLDKAFQRIGSGKNEPAPAMVSAPANDTVADAKDADASANTTAGDRDEDPPKKATRASGGGSGHAKWAALLGTFKTKASGRQAIDQASRHLPSGAGRPGSSLRQVGNRHHKQFRAALTGFKDERTARLACKNIHIKSHTCAAVRVGG
ncbi:MAG: D-alanyl-D-alanine carboxypeptidase family protein [Rhodospirillaceae bacterium]